MDVQFSMNDERRYCLECMCQRGISAETIIRDYGRTKLEIQTRLYVGDENGEITNESVCFI